MALGKAHVGLDEEADLDEFWAAVLRVAWHEGTPKGIQSALLNYYELIHPSCIGSAVRVIQQLKQEPPPAVVAASKRTRRSAAAAASGHIK